jgi:DNA (cytosine-5)-methyltransferase 1
MDSEFSQRTKKTVKENPYVEESNPDSENKVKIVDLFAGIGGFHYGIGSAAAKIDRSVKTLLVSELEPSCQETYSKNHNCEVEGDINKINLGNFLDVADVVTAGFPCQPFSNSGLKQGLSDPRGQFYFKIEEIIKKFGAKSFILENVSGIRTNGGGRLQSKLAVYPQMIGKSMSFLEENLLKLKNYRIKWIEIDSSHLGSPQVRKRVYIIGLHRDFANDFELNFGNYKPNRFIDIADKETNSELELTKIQEKNLRSFMDGPPAYRDGMRRVGQAYLCAGGNVGQGYHSFGMVPTLTKVWARFLPIYFPSEDENRPLINVREFIPNKYYGNGYIRKASVNEVMKLQGFPPSFIPHGKNSIAYEHAGNAVNAKVVEKIAEILLGHITR